MATAKAIVGYGLKHTALISSSIGNQSILVVDIFDDDILTAICKHHAQLSSYGLSASVDAGALKHPSPDQTYGLPVPWLHRVSITIHVFPYVSPPSLYLI
jgi:hypothetical protein